jgi:hypothetical protein
MYFFNDILCYLTALGPGLCLPISYNFFTLLLAQIGYYLAPSTPAH